jgi:Fe-S-cluster-containing hydrogenase component 2
MDCNNKGCFVLEELQIPKPERLKKGPVAVIECAQEIPCNPCSGFCPRGAITVGENINDCPTVDETLCNGCALCLGHCPGLALFLLDNSHEQPRLTLAYELLPPRENTPVSLLDRLGQVVGTGKVLKCRKLKQHDRCTLVTLELETAKQLSTVRGFQELAP